MTTSSAQANEMTAAVKLPLVAAQPGIWVADQISRYANTYTIAHGHQLTGALEPGVLGKAIAEGMAEADTLQLRCVEIDGKVMQQLSTEGLPAIERHDVRDHANPYATAREMIDTDLACELKLSSGQPLVRHLLIRLGDSEWLWYQRYHHIQLDAFSLTELTRRISQLYNAFINQRPAGTSPFVPFSRVIDEYHAYHHSSRREKDAVYWEQVRQDLPKASSLSALPLTDHEPSPHQIRVSSILPRADFSALAAEFRASNAGPADLALALISLWLLRLMNTQEISAGFIFMRRLGSVALNASGPVINVLPMALRLDDDDRLIDLSARITATLKQMRRHQRFDAEDIMRSSGQSLDAAPLYGPVINFKAFDYQLDFDGVESTTEHLATGPVRDLEIQLFVSPEGECEVKLLANAERYQHSELEAHLARLLHLVEQFKENPALPCREADIVLASEHQQIDTINHTAMPVAQDTLVSCLQRQVTETPNAIALVDAEHQLTYQEMQRQVELLAADLSQSGVVTGDIVAVALPRCVRLSIALQAIIRLGAAWLPLDTDYPDDRLALMLEDASPRLLLTQRSQAQRFPAAIPGVLYDELAAQDARVALLPAPPVPENLAYLIYTSGSTGRPKGVMVSHRAIVNRLLWMQHQFPLAQDDVVLQKTPCSFDVSVWEFFWPLMTGARLVMAPPGAHREPARLMELIDRHRVTTLHFVPSMLAAYVGALAECEEPHGVASLRHVFMSGEALPTSLAQRWQQLADIPLWNLYGPTEAAIDVSWYPAFGKELAQVQGVSVPIGYPVWNTRLLILDRYLKAVPPGMPGELYLAGVQLAEGYLGRPQLTAERFIDDPFQPGERLYKSGDIARWLADGAIEYLGRSDDQLKLRGQRIEPGEITAAIENLEGVVQATTQAMVLHKGSQQTEMDSRQLVGYLVADAGKTLDVDVLREQLTESLPPHMVPVALVQLDELPLTTNGKLDKAALPLPATHAATSSRAPRPGLEQTVATAMGELLGMDNLTAEDDFFALGGHSLLALELAATLRNRLEQPVTIGHIMKAARVSALASLLEQEQRKESTSKAGHEHLLWLRKSSGPILFCLHPASGFAWQYSVLPRWLSPEWSVVGVQSAEPNGPLAKAQRLDDIMDAHLHAIRQVQPHGPYYLLGYSLGGTLALAMATRLTQQGERVELVGLLDTWPPESQQWDHTAGPREDDPVIQELQRERQQFVDSQRQLLGSDSQDTSELFATIEGNYAHAVKLLGGVHSSPFDGRVELFVARQSLPQGSDLAQIWKPWLSNLATTDIDSTHVNIIAPDVLRVVGPCFNERLDQCLDEA